MESKEYFEKVMQDFNQNRKGRSLLKYCKDEAIDYDWVMEFRTTRLREARLLMLKLLTAEPTQASFLSWSRKRKRLKVNGQSRRFFSRHPWEIPWR